MKLIPPTFRFTLKFENLDSDVVPTYVHQTTQNWFEDNDQVIKIESINSNTFKIGFTDYLRIWTNNTTIFGEYIYITYVIDGVPYQHRYKESGNILYLAD